MKSSLPSVVVFVTKSMIAFLLTLSFQEGNGSDNFILGLLFSFIPVCLQATRRRRRKKKIISVKLI